MNKITIGLDIAKNIFHLVWLSNSGKVLKKKKLKRTNMEEYFCNLEPAIVVMEACGTSNYWAQSIQNYGHEVKVIAPQYVVPYRKGNKNDFNDAEAIAEASQRVNMRFVPIKSVEQQDIQLLHRIRERRIKCRTALVNQTRGLLAEYGISLSQGVNQVRKSIPDILEDASNMLTPLSRRYIASLYDELIEVDKLITNLDSEIKALSHQIEQCQKLETMTGIGPIIATALYSAIGDGKTFKSGRHMAAWLGLVAKQHTTGDNPKLKGISKRGNTYLRTQLINGARAALVKSASKADKVSLWANNLRERLPFNKAVVALANKMARMAWAMTVKKETYKFV
ncbi:IS110 family transposase [Pseudoalteromonas sp. PAR1]|uniref:IS110 family transposase n=1 Tax=Pseudoalteromonas sp. PAR1 TaxID=2853443 RepID=UPI00248B7F31|nr:IS110 family transposase [Pseudoalteromonas sp. PAR1]|tara:strand:+ start:97 stop:1110 length:1014 start_codon:yes stop_codon:yes gene_type:complete